MQDWIEGMIGAKSPNQATQTFLDALAGFDVRNASYRVLIGKTYDFAFTTGPDAWRAYYFEQGFDRVDPSVLNAPRAHAHSVTCFDPNHPEFAAEGAKAALFDGTREAVGPGAFCTYFRAKLRTSVVSIFTSAPGLQFDTWVRSYSARLSLMSAVFDAKMKEMLEEVKETDQVLTTRERDCVAWLAEGLRVSAIAHTLGVSERTVEFHLTNARHKLQAPTREALVAKVLLGS